MPENPKEREDRSDAPVELLHPFYLDSEMSTSFAAALSGGVALEREEVEEGTRDSKAVRNIRGNLRMFGFGGADAGNESTRSEGTQSASRLVRRHTEASIFLSLLDELRRSGRLKERPESVDGLKPGDLVLLEIGPAVAPMRRVVDQILRIIDVVDPTLASADEEPSGTETRQQRRAKAREAAKAQIDGGEDSEFTKLRLLFEALKSDLDRSGTVDVVVRDEETPSVILTLDQSLATEQTIETLHTAQFIVVGKVTQIWSDPEDFVNLYRRSVVSLVPALAQSAGWGMLAFLFSLASSLDVSEVEKSAREAAGLSEADGNVEGSEASAGDGAPSPTADEKTADAAATEAEALDGGDDVTDGGDDVLIGDVAAEAINPAVNGPAIQVQPVAICI